MIHSLSLNLQTTIPVYLFVYQQIMLDHARKNLFTRTKGNSFDDMFHFFYYLLFCNAAAQMFSLYQFDTWNSLDFSPFLYAFLLLLRYTIK